MSGPAPSAYMPAPEAPKPKGYQDSYGKDKHKDKFKEEGYMMREEGKLPSAQKKLTRRSTRAKNRSTASDDVTSSDDTDTAKSGSNKKPAQACKKKKSLRTTSGGCSAQKEPTIDGNEHNSVLQSPDKEDKKKGGAEVSKESEKAVDAFVEAVTKMGVEGVRKQYDTLKNYEPANKTITAFTANPTKNRYMDVGCLDETRVKLQSDNDYIHANWVKTEERNYIATQGPLDETIEDFWMMCFEESVSSVIMLCQTQEDGKSKCAQYWPPEVGGYNTFGKMFVNNKKAEDNDKFMIYTIEILPEGCSNSHIVRIFHLTSWPDRGTPRTVLRLIRASTAADKLATGPVVVHCSAGIGRTGTIITIDWIQTALFHKAVPVDTTEMFKQLRNQRLSCIQNEGQWLFVHTTILDYISIKMPKHAEVVKKFKADVIALNLVS